MPNSPDEVWNRTKGDSLAIKKEIFETLKYADKNQSHVS